MDKIIKLYQNLKSYLQKFYNPQSTYVEFDDFFQSEKMLNYFGFNNLPQDEPPKNWKERTAFYAFSMINWIVFLVLNVLSFTFSLKQDGSFLVITENAGVICIAGLVLIEGFTIMFWHRERFMDIATKLKQHFPSSAWNQHVFHVFKHLKTSKIFGIICEILYKTLMVQFVSVPVLIVLYELAFGLEVKLEMIIQLQIPLDTTVYFTYSLLYFNAAWALIVGTYTVLITDMLFCELVAIINMELLALGQLMSEIDPSEGQNEAIDELKKLSQTHLELIQISENLKDILSPLLFINCFGLLITLCCAAFLTLVILINDFVFFNRFF